MLEAGWDAAAVGARVLSTHQAGLPTHQRGKLAGPAFVFGRMRAGLACARPEGTTREQMWPYMPQSTTKTMESIRFCSNPDGVFEMIVNQAIAIGITVLILDHFGQNLQTDSLCDPLNLLIAANVRRNVY